MTGKLLILAGAPESHRLDWTTPDLLSTFQTSIAQFAQLQPPLPHHPPITASQQHQPDQDRSCLDLAGWRSLPLERSHIRTGFSQQHDLHFVGAFSLSADFLTTASISLSQGPNSQDDIPDDNENDNDNDNDEESGRRRLVEFYEHSLAVHDDIASSQLVPPGLDSQRTGGTSDTSFVSDTNSHSRSFTSDEGDTTAIAAAEGPTGRSAPKTPLKPGRGGGGTGVDHLSDLEDIPPASYLLSIAPQTMTVTLIAGIISIAAPRIVNTRFGTTKTLVEVLVGDETKSGFSVTFWLSESDDAEGGGGGGGVGGVLAGLRGQDVVLMQNVALNVFQKKVYGGSLRRNMTRVHLLYRGRTVDKEDVGGYYSHADLAKAGRAGHGQGHPQLEKTKRVRDWVLKFVGVGVGVGAPAGEGEDKTTKRGKERERALPRAWNQPPPLDSQ